MLDNHVKKIHNLTAVWEKQITINCSAVGWGWSLIDGGFVRCTRLAHASQYNLKITEAVMNRTEINAAAFPRRAFTFARIGALLAKRVWWRQYSVLYLNFENKLRPTTGFSTSLTPMTAKASLYFNLIWRMRPSNSWKLIFRLAQKCLPKKRTTGEDAACTCRWALMAGSY